MFLRKILHAMYLKIMTVVVFFAPSSRHIVFAGTGSSSQLCEHIIRTGAKRVLVVTDKPLRDLGVVDSAIAGLLAVDMDIAYYDGVLPDPTFAQVVEGAAVAKAHGSEVVLAIGGGSSIDAAKVISAAATSDVSPAEWVGINKIKHTTLKLYAIPTTSGTGSEATIGAVISDAVTHEKAIVMGDCLLPVAAALDADLILGLPPHITAATGMDALTHGIEAYIGVWERGTRLEDARLAVKLVFDNLALAYHDGKDLDARNGMAMGAYYAGLAINQVNVGNVHAIAHQLGGKYGIPHGLANALVLPHVLEFCCQEAQQSLAELGLLVGIGSADEDSAVLAQRFITAVRELRAEVEIPEWMDVIRPEDFETITQQAIQEGATYPVPRLLDSSNVRQILVNIAKPI
jgi:alcohol dehydrogenase class IV